jgi:hypothetical protein
LVFFSFEEASVEYGDREYEEVGSAADADADGRSSRRVKKQRKTVAIA